MSIPFTPGTLAHAHSVPVTGLAWGRPLLVPLVGYTLAAPYSRLCGSPADLAVAVRGIDPYYDAGWQVPTFDFDDYDYHSPTDPNTSSSREVDISATPNTDITDEWIINWVTPNGEHNGGSIPIAFIGGGDLVTSNRVVSAACDAAGFYRYVPNPPFPPTTIPVSIPQMQSKWRIVGPTWGTLITYPPNRFAFGLNGGLEPYPGTDTPVPSSYEFILLQPGESRVIEAEPGGAVTEDNYATPMSIVAFRRGKFPQDFVWWEYIEMDGARIDTDSRRIDA